MHKVVDLDRLIVTRPLHRPDTLDQLQKDIAEHGIRVPILIDTKYNVLDGARRVEAVRRLGVGAVACEVTNDFPRMLENLKAAYADDPSSGSDPLHVVEIYEGLKEYGHAWTNRVRSERQSGVPRIHIKGAVLNLDTQWRTKYREIYGINGWEWDAYSWVYNAAPRWASKSNAHKAAYEQLLEAFYDGVITATALKNQMLNLAKNVAPQQVPTAMVNYMNRQHNRIARAEELAQQRAQPKPLPPMPAAVKIQGLPNLGGTLGQLEGLTSGLLALDYPTSMSEAEMEYVVQHIRSARRDLAKLINKLKGKP